MADNYLEKRYEEVFGRGASRTAAGSRQPGIESLLRKLDDSAPFNPDYKVMPAQMDAVVRVAGLLPPDISVRLEVNVSGNEIFIREISLDAVSAETIPNGVATGIALQSVLFKAAEMGLRGKVTFSDVTTVRIGK